MKGVFAKKGTEPKKILKEFRVKNTENFNRKLPFVFSKNNFGDFVKLKKIIDKSDFQFKEIDSFYYFPSNIFSKKTISPIYFF